MKTAESRWALVTGSAKRIGRAIVLELAAAGFDIIVHYRTSGEEAAATAEEIEALGRRACLAELDLADLRLAGKLIPSLAAELGPLAILVNNASVFIPDRMVEDKTLHATVNAEVPRVLSEAFYEQAPHNGVIVNILDAAPVTPEFSLYNASKKTLTAMTLEMAERFAPRVRVNGVTLGPVLKSPRQSPEHFQKLAEATPPGRAATPQEAAATVRFLVENRELTGTIISTDGELHPRNKKG